MTKPEYLMLSADGQKAYNELKAKHQALLDRATVVQFKSFFPGYLDPLPHEKKPQLIEAFYKLVDGDSKPEVVEKAPTGAWGQVVNPAQTFNAKPIPPKPSAPKPGVLSADDAATTWEQQLVYLSKTTAPEGVDCKIGQSITLSKETVEFWMSFRLKTAESFQVVLHWHPNEEDLRRNKLHFKHDTGSAANYQIHGYNHWLLKGAGITSRVHLADVVLGLNGGKKL